MTTRVAGVKELMEKLSVLAKRAPLATAYGLYEGMQNIMVVAKDRAPKLTTTMAESGYVTPPEMSSAGEAKIGAGFGGGSEEYVVRQHEDTSLNHPRGGQAHFFSSALDEGEGQMVAIVERRMAHFLATGDPGPLPAKIVPYAPDESVPSASPIIAGVEGSRSGG